MAQITPYVGIILVAVILITLLRENQPEMAILLSVVVGVIVFLKIAGALFELVRIFDYLADKAQVNSMHLDLIFKIIGVAYLAGFGAQICRDAGEGALALKLELAGKITILFLAAPVMGAIMEMVFRIL